MVLVRIMVKHRVFRSTYRRYMVTLWIYSNYVAWQTGDRNWRRSWGGRGGGGGERKKKDQTQPDHSLFGPAPPTRVYEVALALAYKWNITRRKWKANEIEIGEGQTARTLFLNSVCHSTILLKCCCWVFVACIAPLRVHLYVIWLLVYVAKMNPFGYDDPHQRHTHTHSRSRVHINTMEQDNKYVQCILIFVLSFVEHLTIYGLLDTSFAPKTHSLFSH